MTSFQALVMCGVIALLGAVLWPGAGIEAADTYGSIIPNATDEPQHLEPGEQDDGNAPLDEEPPADNAAGDPPPPPALIFPPLPRAMRIVVDDTTHLTQKIGPLERARRRKLRRLKKEIGDVPRHSRTFRTTYDEIVYLERLAESHRNPNKGDWVHLGAGGTAANPNYAADMSQIEQEEPGQLIEVVGSTEESDCTSAAAIDSHEASTAADATSTPTCAPGDAESEPLPAAQPQSWPYGADLQARALLTQADDDKIVADDRRAPAFSDDYLEMELPSPAGTWAKLVKKMEGLTLGSALRPAVESDVVAPASTFDLSAVLPLEIQPPRPDTPEERTDSEIFLPADSDMSDAGTPTPGPFNSDYHAGEPAEPTNGLFSPPNWLYTFAWPASKSLLEPDINDAPAVPGGLFDFSSGGGDSFLPADGPNQMDTSQDESAGAEAPVLPDTDMDNATAATDNFWNSSSLAGDSDGATTGLNPVDTSMGGAVASGEPILQSTDMGDASTGDAESIEDDDFEWEPVLDLDRLTCDRCLGRFRSLEVKDRLCTDCWARGPYQPAAPPTPPVQPDLPDTNIDDPDTGAASASEDDDLVHKSAFGSAQRSAPYLAYKRPVYIAASNPYGGNWNDSYTTFQGPTNRENGCYNPPTPFNYLQPVKTTAPNASDDVQDGSGASQALGGVGNGTIDPALLKLNQHGASTPAAVAPGGEVTNGESDDESDLSSVATFDDPQGEDKSGAEAENDALFAPDPMYPDYDNCPLRGIDRVQADILISNWILNSTKCLGRLKPYSSDLLDVLERTDLWVDLTAVLHRIKQINEYGTDETGSWNLSKIDSCMITRIRTAWRTIEEKSQTIIEQLKDEDRDAKMRAPFEEIEMVVQDFYDLVNHH